ncbi:TPA: hypothetical protein I6W77_003246 [Vibrio cholerae]|uniref:hypothetical protein n=1 Tax=Vibrio cholerae TaxID=666 RepID=UPI0005B55009|nr:hypothetical protein [Vibrio cholerae]EGR0524975.1 hypothetical protein [Vibrio cholerae]EGR0600843.1 hypothetical protein [Vibrio cholerae]HAS2628754.1 hypothetical protein [Vibrio cholerae]HAS4509412.1 hypothetical protein [Vibrio cholerae]
MSDGYQGLSVSAVKELLKSPNNILRASAKPYSGGYVLNIIDGEITFIVASYRSNMKVYKRADALLNDAKDMGFESVTFEL